MLRIRNKKRLQKCIGAALAILTASGAAVYAFVLSPVQYTGINTSASGEQPAIMLSTKPSMEAIDAEYDTITLGEEALHSGNLILINKEHAFTFPSSQQLISVYERKNESYHVKDRNVLLEPAAIEALNEMMQNFSRETGCYDILVESGYRSPEYQQQLYNEKAEETSPQEADRWLAHPGKSEHHSGYAIDFGIFRNGKCYRFADDPDSGWILNHAHEFGFVLRYPQGKEAETGFGYEPWHFRYIGNPHAFLMQEKGITYEKYIIFLQQYIFGKQHLKVTYRNTAYEIYHVPSTGSATAVSVPRNKNYVVSGDNHKGYIVTIEQ